MSPVTPVLRFHLMSGGRRESPRIVRFPPIAETIFLQHLFCGSSSRMGPQPSRHLFSTDRPKAHRAIPRGTVNLVNFPSGRSHAQDCRGQSENDLPDPMPRAYARLGR